MNVRWQKSQYMSQKIKCIYTEAIEQKSIKYLEVQLQWDAEVSVRARLRKCLVCKYMVNGKDDHMLARSSRTHFYADYFLELMTGSEINLAFVIKVRKRTATPKYLLNAILYSMIEIKVLDILDLNVNAQRLGWWKIKKKLLKGKFISKFATSTKGWKKSFVEYGFPLLAVISTEINWRRKCTCGVTMRKTHYMLTPGSKTWKKWFLGKDLLLVIQGMSLLGMRKIVKIIENAKACSKRA